VEKINAQKSLLEQEFIEAAQDKQRNREFADWEVMSRDGLDDQNAFSMAKSFE
jgi:hypothetical protein